MAIAASTKEAKYTQGFCFQQDETGHDRARQVVERSCAAVVTLMQELFVQAERELSRPLAHAMPIPSRERLLEQLAEVVRARPVVEQVVIASVACAFARLEDHARGNQDNHHAIEQTLAKFRQQVCEQQDLETLLGVEEKITHANNSNRPLLVHLNAQWVTVFSVPEFRLPNSPVDPATLTGGFIAGLLCVRADIATKRFLFQMFEQHVLARLAILLNGISLRLEEEGVAITRAVSVDESDAGPIQDIVQGVRKQNPESIRRYVEELKVALGKRDEFVAVSPAMADALAATLEHSDPDSHIEMLSELKHIKQALEPVLLRVDVHHQETVALMTIRKTIADQLNGQLEGRTLPASITEFFSRLWPDVLFEVAVSHGVGSSEWMNVMLLQQQLLQSVSPAESEEQRTSLPKLVPVLVKGLRDRLEQASYSLAETSLFFTQLKQLHLANVQQKLEPGDFVPWQSLSLDACVPGEVVMASESDRDFYQQVRAIVG